MKTRKHIHQEVLPATPEQVFTLLHTPSAIREWWFATRAIVVPEKGGLWAAAWGEDEDDPDYISSATILEFDPPSRLVLSYDGYYAKSGPLPFEANFTAEFLITADQRGTVLQVTQDGFPAGPEANEFYAGCQQGWADTFAGIQAYLKNQ